MNSSHLTSDITVGIKTFYRENKLKQLFDSLIGIGFKEAIVADDGKETESKERLYKEYAKRLPLKVIRLDYDTGLSFGRNRIVDQTNTPYLLMLDDDQVVPKNINDLKQVLNADETIGGVSGYWNEYGHIRCDASNLYQRGDYLFKDTSKSPVLHKTGNVTYYLLDQIPNSTLFRTECLKKFPWDEHFKIGSEHVDFYLNHKHNSSWKFAVTPDVVITHDPKGEENYDTNFRLNQSRLQESRRYLLNKWQLKGIIEGRKLYHPKIPVSQRIKNTLISLHCPPNAVLAYQNLHRQIISKLKSYR